MTIEALEGVTDQELFDDAHSDEPITDEVVSEEPVAEVVEQIEQPRDEAGRFATTAETPAPTPAATDALRQSDSAARTPAPAPVDDNAAMVPSWRVREINEEKRTLADKLAALEAERSQWQRQPAPQAQPVAPQAKVEEPDPLLDPQGYKEFILNETREIMLNERREMSLANAHRTHKAEFEEAYAAAQKHLDPVLKMKMHTSRDPGETLIEWHREQKTRAEVGNDINAFRQREQERLLSDPAFLAKAIEKARGVAQPTSGRSPSPVSLPPSLTRATNASTITSADDEDISNDGLWRHANS